MNKVLIIRFSSFGDIVQCLASVPAIRQIWPNAEIHWAVRSDFASLLQSQPGINRVWPLERQNGVLGLCNLARALARENFTHVYDAHNNLRSRFVAMMLRWHRWRLDLTRRPKNRWKRMLLFRFHIQTLPAPFVGQKSYLQPLEKWHLPEKFFLQGSNFLIGESARSKVSTLIQNRPFVALVPGAAWELKRWPISHWKEFVCQNRELTFVVLGGAEDTFCEEIASAAHERVQNLAGKLSLSESCAVIEQAMAVIANDTGLMHVADLMGRPTIALIGPTAFGYPASPTSQVAEVQLTCKPCSKDGRGRCRNTTYKKCMVDVSPEFVQKLLRKSLGNLTR